MSFTAEPELSERIVLEKRRDYHLFDYYCCNSLRRSSSYEVVEFSKSEASGRSRDLEAESDDAGGPPHSLLTLLSSFYSSSSVFSVP